MTLRATERAPPCGASWQVAGKIETGVQGDGAWFREGLEPGGHRAGFSGRSPVHGLAVAASPRPPRLLWFPVSEGA